MQQDQKPIAIFVVGGPGSGKGTQCKKLKEKNPTFEHLSTGSLLREYVMSGGQETKHIDQMMKEGKLIPSEYVVKALHYKIFKLFPAKKVFLLDGFPRNAENFQKWQEIIKDTIVVRFLLYIECDLVSLKERLLNRAKIQKRADDNPETIQKRFQTFHTYTETFCNQYKKSHKTFYVDGKGTVDEVFQRVSKAIL